MLGLVLEPTSLEDYLLCSPKSITQPHPHPEFEKGHSSQSAIMQKNGSTYHL